MPRLTRRSLASKEDEQTTPAKAEPAKRGSRKSEPVAEPLPIGEGNTPAKRSARGKGTPAKETPKGNARTSSRGRVKKEESDEEIEEEEEELPPPKRGARGGRGKKEEPEPKKDTPAPKRGSRGGRGKKEEPEEDEVASPTVKSARGARSKKEETEAPFAKKTTRGRGKKEEEPEEEVEETPSPAKKAPVKGKGKRGGRGSKQDVEEVDEAEMEVEEEEEQPKESPVPKGRKGRSSRGSQVATPTPPLSGGRKRGRRGEGDGITTEETAAAVEATPTGSSDSTTVDVEPEVMPESIADKEEPEVSSEVTEEGEKAEETSEAKEEEENMEVETIAAAIEEPEKATDIDQSNRKRKLDEEDVVEQDGSTKRAKTTEGKEADIASEFVVVNKEDLPAPDSKEVEEALPPAVEPKVQETPVEPKTEEKKIPAVFAEPTPNAENVASTKTAPTVVPLTEAELAKQYNPTIRDRDENSSMMVEVGSEAASDVGSVSRNLDVSEVAAMDVTTNMEDAEASKEEVSKTDCSQQATQEKILPELNSAPETVSALDAQTEQVSPQPITQDLVQPARSQIPAPASLPDLPAAPANEVQLNSVPTLSNNVNASNADLLPPPPQSTTVPPPSSIPPPPAANQNAHPQNGSCKPAPLLTSTPAKKPVVIDSSYVASSPSITQRKVISNPKFPVELMDPAMWFSVVSYNILADCHLRRYNYSYTESQYLDLTYRHSVFLKEFEYLDSDIVCLQEVDTDYYHNILLPAMTSRGYQGVFMKRTQDWYAEGEATFVKTSKFEVMSHQGISLRDLAYGEIEVAGLSGDVARAAKKYVDRADVVLLCSLKSKKTGKQLTVANIHVLFDPKAPDLQCIQVASAVKELVSKAGSDLNPYIICGDFNSETTSPAYQLAKDGYLSDEHIRQLQNIQSMDNTEGSSHSIIHYLWKAFQHTSSNLKSAYETCVGKEPEVTSLNGLVRACLDYIFYSSSTMYAVNVLEALDPKVVDATGGLPSKDIPSDHLSMKAVFRLKD